MLLAAEDSHLEEIFAGVVEYRLMYWQGQTDVALWLLHLIRGDTALSLERTAQPNANAAHRADDRMISEVIYGLTSVEMKGWEDCSDVVRKESMFGQGVMVRAEERC